MQIKQAFARGRLAVMRFFAERNPVSYFILLTFLGIAVLCVRLAIGGERAWIGLFFKECSQLFMDFFNPVRDAAQGIEVYTRLGSIYPPLSNLFISLFSLFLPRAYLDTPLEQADTWRAYPAVILAYFVFFLLSLLFMALLLQREPHAPAKRHLLTFSLLASFPMLFLLERGNTMILCLAFMLIFVQNYHSEHRVAREIALIALAIATALKFYPVLLGAVLLGDKRWREAARAAVYGLFCLFLPSFFYGGPISVFWAIRYTLGFSEYSSAPSISFMQQNAIPLRLGGTVLYCLYISLILLAVVVALLERRSWRAWMIAGCVMLTMPSIFSSYNWLLLLPALIAFFRKERLHGTNWIYFFGMTLPFFTFPPRPAQDPLEIVCLLALYFTYVTESLVCFCIKCRKRHLAENR